MKKRHLSGKEDTDKQDQRLRSSSSELVLQLFENQSSHPCLLSTLTPSSTLQIARNLPSQRLPIARNKTVYEIIKR